MARSILSTGILFARAFSMAVRRRGFPLGSPPPMRATTVISLMSLENMAPRLASVAPFLRLIVDHLECPDMVLRPFRFLYHTPFKFAKSLIDSILMKDQTKSN